MRSFAFIAGEAAGAIPNDARVRKCAFEEGDGTPIGSEGVVRSSHAFTAQMMAAVRAKDPSAREVAFAYWVEWDWTPGVPVFVSDWEIEVAS